jgi:hypothetical protein
MSKLLTIGAVAFAICRAAPAFAAQPDAMAHMPARKAFDTSQKAGPGCLAGGHLVAHAAYRPADVPTLRCGQLLTTDTLVTLHHWDHT